MVSHLVVYQLGLIVLVWVFLMLYGLWPLEPAAARPMPPKPLIPRGKHSKKPKPFPGLTRKPCCTACEQVIEVPRLQPSPPPPPTMTSTRGRRRHVNTAHHFCPDPDCRYGGWLGLGNITSNGHPSGGPWRQLYCGACHGYFLETHGTPLHGKRVAPDKLVWAIGALAEGLGIRAVARVFEVDPHTVLAWLIEVADHATAFSRYFLHDVRVTQIQLDELFALLSAVKAGVVSETEAIRRLSRSPQWVWTALDPVTKLLLTIDVGDRTRAMAQSVVHQVAQVLAPGCVPLVLTDGFKEYTTALLTHYGQWVQPARQRAQGLAPKPRWMPLPQLLYAQVIKTVRRRRLVRVRHRVVWGTLAAVQQVLAAAQERLSMQGQCQRWHSPPAWHQFLTTWQQTEWVVYAKPPLPGPQLVLRYLARYTHRVAITNRRLLACADGQVTFRWKDYQRGNRQRLMTLDAVEFIRRLLLHVLPRGFQRMRHYGFCANGLRKVKLPRCRQLLGQAPLLPSETSPPVDATATASRPHPRSDRCPVCLGGQMQVQETWFAQRTARDVARPGLVCDTS